LQKHRQQKIKPTVETNYFPLFPKTSNWKHFISKVC